MNCSRVMPSDGGLPALAKKAFANLPTAISSMDTLLSAQLACAKGEVSVSLYNLVHVTGKPQALFDLQSSHGDTCTAFVESHLQHFAQLLVGESAFVFHVHQIEGKCNTIFYSASVEGQHSPYKSFVADKPRFLCTRLQVLLNHW